jgi:membrane glycosyltransferase
MWLLPVLVGMVLAAPIIRLTSSTKLGLTMRKWGVFLIDQELNECKALKRLRVAMSYFAISQYSPKTLHLPESLWLVMPEQILNEKPLPMRYALLSNS